MDAATTIPYVKHVNTPSRQNTKYHFALEDLNRARAKKWIAHNDSEMKLMIYKAHAAHLADLEVERDAADAALYQLAICLKTGEERLARAQRRLDKAREDDSELLQTSAYAKLEHIESSAMMLKADEVFQREAEQHRVLPIGDRDVSVSEDYQTPPPEFTYTSSLTEQVEGGEEDPRDGEVEAMSVSSSTSEMPHLLVERTTGPPSLVREQSFEPLTEPSVVSVKPLRPSRARSTTSRHQPYFRSAGNIMKWQLQQLVGSGGEINSKTLEAASERLARVRDRLVKSPEVEYLGETVRLEQEEE